MGLNLEEMAGKLGLDKDAVKKAAESGDISKAMDSLSSVFGDKVDMDAIKGMIPENLDMNAVKDMLKDIDISKLSPEMLKDMAEKFMKKD